MNDAPPQPAETYLQLRKRILNLKPAELDLAPTAAIPDLWGVIVELGYDVGSATLVALADGTTSLHYSTGGGLLGRADYAPLAETSKALVAEAQKYIHQMKIATDFSIPAAGQVSFLLLGYAGIYSASTREKLLSSRAHPLASLFQRTQEVLGELRSLAEKKRT